MNIERKSKISAQASMSSMTDLVFLLLIFFIVMSTLANPALPVELPKTGGISQHSSDVHVGIDKEYGFFLDAKKTKFYTIEELAPVLRAKVEASGQTKVAIDADRTAHIQKLAEVLSVVKENGWEPILNLEN